MLYVQDKLQDISTKLSSKIDVVNELIGLPLNPRGNSGAAVDPHAFSIHQLYLIVSLLSVTVFSGCGLIAPRAP